MTSKLISRYTEKETLNKANYEGNKNHRGKHFISAPMAIIRQPMLTSIGEGVGKREPCATLVGTWISPGLMGHSMGDPQRESLFLDM